MAEYEAGIEGACPSNTTWGMLGTGVEADIDAQYRERVSFIG